MTTDLTTYKRRLSYFLKSEGITLITFFASTEIKRGFLDTNKLDRSVTDENIIRIMEAYPQLNLMWVLTGEGEMLTSENRQLGMVAESTVPYEAKKQVNYKAQVEMLQEQLAAKDKEIKALIRENVKLELSGKAAPQSAECADAS